MVEQVRRCIRHLVKVVQKIDDMWDMILIDEAVARYADSVGPYGARPQRNSQPRRLATLLDEIDQLLPADLRLPRDLRHFWTNWNPASFGLVLGDGLPTLERTLVEWESSSLPNILMLLCSMDRQCIYIEIESDAHPGTRLYLTDTEDQVLRLWGLGLDGFLDAVATAYRHTGASASGPCNRWVDLRLLHELAGADAERILAVPTDRRVDLNSPSTWPAHWQLANGLAETTR